MKATTEVTIELSMDDIIDMVKQKIKETPYANYELVSVKDKTKTITIPGYDPHDADYIQEFDGLKIQLKQ